MGIFKQMKDMKATVSAAPDVIDQADELAEQSPQVAATQQGTAQPATAQADPSSAAEGPDFEPIAGVTLELYVAISKGLAAHNYDLTKAADVAASKGVDESAWTAAVDGWNARMRSNPSVGQRFNLLYTAA
jgi:hypothetical protein